MTRAIPQPPLPPQRPAMEGYSTPSRSAAEANSLRLAFVAERLSLLFRTGFRSEDLLKPCFSLARGIDYALSNNDVPSIVSRLPSLVKQVYQYKSDTSLQSAITVLMISVKNACRNGWFHVADTDELIRMANELCSSFCMSTNITAEVSNALNTISKIIPRFYPHLKLGRLIVSFEAKPGYDILMADFLIQKYVPPEEKIGLFVAQTDDLETSSCLISPPQVSFLVNGKGVARRTNVFLDTGPQFPTDITKMLKYGTNIIQAVGYFSGNYIIAVSFMSKMTSSNGPVLKDYVQPVLAALAPDSEIIEGASRISLNCPISFRRINTPVKGHLCKHHQCFGYENFMEMNSRKPSWRCPCCNQPTSFIDLRIDQNMVKILQDVRVDITDVVISADGSWKVVVECNGSTDQVHNGTLAEQKDGKIGGESYGISNALANVVDLTMDEDGGSDNNTYEDEDRKPFKDFQGFPVSESFPEQSLAHHATLMSQGVANQIGDDIWPRTWSAASTSNGSSVPATTLDAHRVGTLESLVPNSVLNPVITDAISPALGRESTASLAVNQPAFTSQNVSQLAENIQRQPSRLGNSIISSEIERLPIPSQVSRAPIAIQALPAQTQASSSSQWTCSNILNSSSNIPSGSPSVSFQTVPSTTAIPGGFNTISSDIEMQQVSRASDIVSSLLQLHSVIQNWDQGRQYSLNSTLQQVVGLPAPTQACTRLPSDQQRVGSYRASLQPPSDYQNPHHQLVNLRGRQTMSQCTNTLPQSSCSPSVQVQQALQNDVGVAAGSSVNHHNQLLAARRASQLARLQSVHPFASGAGSSFPMTADSLRLMGGEQLQNMVGGPLAVSRTERLPELPSEHNWRPTGRMRGSLTGSAYSAALNHHLVQPSQQIPARPPTPSTVATSDQLPVLISNSINARGSLVQQANWRYSDLGN